MGATEPGGGRSPSKRRRRNGTGSAPNSPLPPSEASPRLHYQPIVNVDGGAVCGLEALVRWQHPTDGLIPPGVFIPLAERNGAITAITQWVPQQACKDVSELLSQREAPLSVAVNLSAVELARPRLADDVSRVLFGHWLSAITSRARDHRDRPHHQLCSRPFLHHGTEGPRRDDRYRRFWDRILVT